MKSNIIEKVVFFKKKYRKCVKILKENSLPTLYFHPGKKEWEEKFLNAMSNE